MTIVRHAAHRVDTAFCFGEFEPGERELRHLSDDQSICVGYANPIALEVMRERDEEVPVALCCEPGGAELTSNPIELRGPERSARGRILAALDCADPRFATYAVSKRLRGAVGEIPLTDFARWGAAFARSTSTRVNRTIAQSSY